MSRIKIHDKEFELSISNAEINNEIERVAVEINRDYAGKRPLLIGILNGSFMFASELMLNLNIECEITFVKFSSYDGAATTGVIRELIGLTDSVEGRDVIIVEDIVDTGYTMQHILKSLAVQKPASVQIATLFSKPSSLKVPIDIKYCAFNITDRFIVGFGLDYDGLGRNLPDVYDIVLD